MIVARFSQQPEMGQVCNLPYLARKPARFETRATRPPLSSTGNASSPSGLVQPAKTHSEGAATRILLSPAATRQGAGLARLVALAHRVLVPGAKVAGD